jgi:uncharacterized membrane protein
MTILLFLKQMGLVLNIIGALIIGIGAAYALFHFLRTFIKRSERTYGAYGNIPINNIRLLLGRGVVLGLEFMVAGDLVYTIATPDYYELGLLAILVIIRTVLSYFLTWELATVSAEEHSR